MRKETKQAIEDKKIYSSNGITFPQGLIHSRDIRGIVLTETSALEKTIRKQREELEKQKKLLAESYLLIDKEVKSNLGFRIDSGTIVGKSDLLRKIAAILGLKEEPING